MCHTKQENNQALIWERSHLRFKHSLYSCPCASVTVVSARLMKRGGANLLWTHAKAWVNSHHTHTFVRVFGRWEDPDVPGTMVRRCRKQWGENECSEVWTFWEEQFGLLNPYFSKSRDKKKKNAAYDWKRRKLFFTGIGNPSGSSEHYSVAYWLFSLWSLLHTFPFNTKSHKQIILWFNKKIFISAHCHEACMQIRYSMLAELKWPPGSTALLLTPWKLSLHNGE